MPLNTGRHINICSFQKNKATWLVWIIFSFKQVKLGSQLRNSKKAICLITSGCGKKPVLAIDETCVISYCISGDAILSGMQN